jgi:hypothetical protein
MTTLASDAFADPSGHYRVKAADVAVDIRTRRRRYTQWLRRRMNILADNPTDRFAAASGDGFA